jgi:hypothetical protein
VPANIKDMMITILSAFFIYANRDLNKTYHKISWQNSQKTAIPCTGNIPEWGWLFRQTGRRLNKSELVLLTTPQLVKSQLRRQGHEAT